MGYAYWEREYRKWIDEFGALTAGWSFARKWDGSAYGLIKVLGLENGVGVFGALGGCAVLERDVATRESE